VNREQKTQAIERLQSALASAPSVVVAGFSGFTVEATDKLRSELRKSGVSYEVVKNTLVKRAIAGTDKEGMGALLKGNSAIAFHSEDPALPAKLLKDFAKTNAALTLRGGWVAGDVLDAAGVEVLSKLPGKNELRAQLLSLFSAPASSFARLLQAKLDQANGGAEATSEASAEA